ncbi:protein of unknown function [Taphrina deformans PYCC 5710]|uniref:C2H2-type domain-containing protein n=1 Tax=Taphrina deformans (strain PYCC 5710 / ATCC 11124 / CBS 356.35 / IMI 108563 / JCM 9778 / NBRC 8474) TaxID=1097556 RepID=R4XJV6_TAPDE|nr:protein of unknown function [Taphrina deformans PYCC 5710]|eukprot:CCG84723.1 protein of unknown function [Taphrina deformans PYCC 5710]
MSEAEIQANSFVCDECGASLRNSAAVQLHAEKTEHQSFSESVEVIQPLTEEEKKIKLQELREKLAAKRKIEADKELENVKKNASIERKKTQESAEMIEDLQRKEQLKVIAAKKKEKEEDQKARVKAQLEQDRKDRAERAAQEKAARTGVPLQAETPSVSTAASSASKKTVDHSSGRLQIRHGTGKPITRTWPKDATVLQVAEDIYPETGIEPQSAVFKMFGLVIKGSDLHKSLAEMKLVPSASLQLS